MIFKCDINENNFGVVGCIIVRWMLGVYRNNIGGGYKNIMKYLLILVISVIFGNYIYWMISLVNYSKGILKSYLMSFLIFILVFMCLMILLF